MKIRMILCTGLLVQVALVSTLSLLAAQRRMAERPSIFTRVVGPRVAPGVLPVAADLRTIEAHILNALTPAQRRIVVDRSREEFIRGSGVQLARFPSRLMEIIEDETENPIDRLVAIQVMLHMVLHQ